MKYLLTVLTLLYSITIPDSTYTLVVSYVGFQTKEFPVILNKDIRINVSLLSSAIETQEINISAERADQNIQSTEMGRQKLDIERPAPRYPSNVHRAWRVSFTWCSGGLGKYTI